MDGNAQWHPMNDEGRAAEEGFLVREYSDICVTPGLTYELGAGAYRASIPKHNHAQVLRVIAKCNGSSRQKSCVARLKSLHLGAIRARTATSAGMVGVVTHKKSGNGKRGNEQDVLWQIMHNDFSISSPNVRKTRELIIKRQSEIAAENLSGQCTKGHSCKEGAKAGLENLINNCTNS